MRVLQGPLHGRPVGPTLPRGGAACRDARLKNINRKQNAQWAECSALLAARKLDWLVSACPPETMRYWLSQGWTGHQIRHLHSLRN
eukprot:3770754-Pyramimonas_sp.AAC.1